MVRGLRNTVFTFDHIEVEEHVVTCHLLPDRNVAESDSEVVDVETIWITRVIEKSGVVPAEDVQARNFVSVGIFRYLCVGDFRQVCNFFTGKPQVDQGIVRPN